MKYILYGAGRDGIIAMKYLGRENIKCFCETHTEKEEIYGVPVICVDEIADFCDNSKILISVSKTDYAIEIAKILTLHGYEYTFWETEVKNIIKQEGNLYNQRNIRASFEYSTDDEHIIVRDRYDCAGTITSYFWQDLWAAQLVFAAHPSVHYDIGSRIDGFIAHLLSYKQAVSQIDIRPLECQLDGLNFICADATNMECFEEGSIESLSALCSLEHFGLGRYGDNIDPEACFRCFAAIQDKIMKGGKLYLSLPIGKEHLEFNAHRVFFARTVIDSFSNMKLLEYSSCYKDVIERNISINKYDGWSIKGGERFGLFLFEKL